MNCEEEIDSPYCNVCGHCGYIGCCGIIGFINEHIRGKTNCENEDCIIEEIISICDFETIVFKENKELKKQLQAYKDKEDKLRELFEKKPRYDKEKKQHILRVGTMEEILKILDGSDE